MTRNIYVTAWDRHDGMQLKISGAPYTDQEREYVTLDVAGGPAIKMRVRDARALARALNTIVDDIIPDITRAA